MVPAFNEDAGDKELTEGFFGDLGGVFIGLFIMGEVSSCIPVPVDVV